MEGLSAFFYGTLMHPKILQRVIGHSGADLKLCPAVLLDFTRHQVQYADYPGILPYSRSQKFFGFTLDDQETRSVRGTMVTGLTQNDIELLDIFEGSEYVRQRVQVHPLGELERVPDMSPAEQTAIVPAAPPPLPSGSNLVAGVQAYTYVYLDASNLLKDLWSYEDFVKKNAWKWIGGSKETEEEYYSVVDQRNAAQTKALTESEFQNPWVDATVTNEVTQSHGSHGSHPA